MKTRGPRQRGFSPREVGVNLFEVMLILATVALLGLVVLPWMAKSKVRINRISCTSNLKQVGLAFRLFSNDHGDQFPFAVAGAEGGSLEFTNSPQVFRHFEALSNELVTPRILFCPQEFQTSTRVWATNFLNLANTNLSYFVAPDGDETRPNRFLSGDRDISGGRMAASFLRILSTTNQAGWGSGLHTAESGRPAGNIGLSDGSVQQLSPAELNRAVASNGLPAIRLLIP